MRKKIGECLIQAGLITEDDLRAALAEHKRTGERLGVVLVRMNLATEKQIAGTTLRQELDQRPSPDEGNSARLGAAGS